MNTETLTVTVTPQGVYVADAVCFTDRLNQDLKNITTAGDAQKSAEYFLATYHVLFIDTNGSSLGLSRDEQIEILAMVSEAR